MEIVAQPQTEVKRSRGRNINIRGFLGKRKKMLILTGMFVLLIVTGYLNWTLNSGTPDVGGGGGAGAGTQQHMFVTFRQVRQTERASQLAMLEHMALATSGFSETARTQAEQQILALQTSMQFETTGEGLIRAMGFQDAVVSQVGQNINVLVRNPENITQEQATQIKTQLEHIAGRDLLDHIFIQVVE